MKSPVMLMILDGFGINKSSYGNAIKLAHKPVLDRWMEDYPHNQLSASGLSVGLPEGQMGNSEVGHLNIGAGRVVYQDLTRISMAIEDGSFFSNPALKGIMARVKERDGILHLFGLVSDGGVHSHIDHLKGLLKMAKEEAVKEVQIACFLDGRDVPPRSAINYLDDLQAYIDEIGIGKISLVSGRYYAMDRDNRWNRTELCYDALTLGMGIHASNYLEAINQAYERGQDDEFIEPVIISNANPVFDEDGIIFFNFRPDRARQLTRSFVDPAFEGFHRKRVFDRIDFVCMCQYDVTMPGVALAFLPEKIEKTLGEVIAQHGLNQLRIAETEKYAHVTFFFNGGVEKANLKEERILIPSPRVPTYDLQPEMSAYEVRDRVLEELDKGKFDLIVLNFANADMVGHSGKIDAAIKAIEALEKSAPPILEKVLSLGGQVIVTADHGNAERMLDENGKVVTAHSNNPVPIVHVAKEAKAIRDGGSLRDLAPTLLEILGIEKPEEMTGESLFI